MSSRRVFSTFFAGVLLVQVAWMAAMPAFRGPDEFDHVFRAEGVAHGAIAPGDTINRQMANGTMTPARRSVIDAASQVCASYGYTHYYDCHPYEDRGDGLATVGSGAGQYNPGYYFVVGSIGRLFDGVSVDYAIRLITAVVCALLLAWAAVLWSVLGGSRWRTLALLVALTPVLLYSTAVAAPNGITYSSAILLWTAGFVVLGNPDKRNPGAPRVAAAISAAAMCNTHTTGPLWLLLIAVSWLILDWRSVLRVLRARSYWPMVVAIGLGAVTSVAWTALSGANLPDTPNVIDSGPKAGALFGNEVAWLLQTIAAFPLRNERAPVPVYFLWLFGFVLLLVLVFRTKGPGRKATAWIMLSAIGVATALTFLSYKTEGYAWQGRYGLPLTVGLALIPGLVSTSSRPLHVALLHSSVVAMMLSTAISIWHVAHNERRFLIRPWTDHVWSGPLIAAVVAAAGIALMAWTLERGVPRSPDIRETDPLLSGAEDMQSRDREAGRAV